ncbi:hypothetical protein AU476_15330 [Cupriavidus sp. UYMSc13B]|nr:hypothetical protein AU476_15330 [Cupriavidus sp. UYMSc13B]
MNLPLNLFFRRIAALLGVSVLLLTTDGALAANATISGRLVKGGITFNYSEVKYGANGKGARGIRIYISGGHDQSYKFNPNPHNNPSYNSDPGSFYLEAANALADAYLAKHPNPGFPRYGFTSTIKDIKYIYEQR